MRAYLYFTVRSLRAGPPDSGHPQIQILPKSVSLHFALGLKLAAERLRSLHAKAWVPGVPYI